MRMVAESEAETHLPDLVDEVQRGTAIAITRHGKPVAALTSISDEFPAHLPRVRHSPEEVRAAMVQIREQAKAAGMKFDWEEVKRWRDEGRH
jgi:prevent-host-death family protein